MSVPVIWEINADYPLGRARSMTAGELAQLESDQAAAAAHAAADAQVAADRDALVAKLAAGKATPAEMQAALAQLLT